MPDPIPLKLTGRETKPELPPLLQVASRSAAQPKDPFFPAGYLVPIRTFDVSAAARSVADGVSEKQHDAQPDEVMVFELADGSTFITSTQRLRDTLALTHPELLGENGEILLEKFRTEAAARRGLLGDAVGGLISKVFTLIVDTTKDGITTDAVKKLADAASLGVSWAGTKALMSAIESKLDQPPGLYRWIGASGRKEDLESGDFKSKSPKDLEQNPMLVFIHGTGSSTLGSFGDLRVGDRDLWPTLERRFTGGIYAFEHRTLSESPIENAIQLARALPQGAKISLVSHSRGGLVADLLCLGDFDALIDKYHYAFPGTGDADAEEARRVKKELEAAHAEQRDQLRELATLLREQKLVIERYVRTASPANGTKLASGNFDVFLSSLLTLIGAVPFFFGSPYYAAFKRVVIDIAKNRTNPHLVPGIEAMLPDSPMAQLLHDAPVRKGIEMSVIAGDIEGGNLLKRLGVLLTDFLLFDNTDNDLVVDTEAMLSGVAPALKARVLFDRGSDVSHFRYFTNFDTRTALRDWLVSDKPQALDAFRALPAPEEFAAALAAASAAARDALAATRPVVVVLPGVMGSYLNVSGKDRVWFDVPDIALGGLEKIQWGKSGIEAEGLFSQSYGELCQELAKSHRVEPFPYDWRQPLDVLGERLGEFLDRLMKETDKPIRLLAHSMGGLVVRACIYKRRPVMDALMARNGARLVMCGTPHQGAHSMVENLIGKGDTLRTLVQLDVKHEMQQVLDIVSGFRGALQLLPRPGFRDIFQGEPEGGEIHDYSKAETWTGFKPTVRDFWFGDGRCGTPAQDTLDSASWLWSQDNARTGAVALPAEYEGKSIYVFGVARNTPCGVRAEGGRLKMVGTTRGDGTVTWDSGRIGGIGAFYFLPAVHGDLLATRDYFPALVDLLAAGVTARLSSAPPAVRAIEQPAPVSYDAGPPTADAAQAAERDIMGASLRNRVPARTKRRLEVAVKAMDLRFLTAPIMVGHYEQDPIAGPERLIDGELLDGDLSKRHSLGLYAGPRGSAVVVLRVLNGYGQLRGAVVTGLGQYDGALNMSDLSEAVRTGALRYLLQIVDLLGSGEREVTLATLLLGYNSSANLTIAASVEALVRGVMDANAKFYDTTRLNIRIARLDIVELYLDTAITAVYSARRLRDRLAAQAEKNGTTLIVRGELEQGEGLRLRLFDDRGSNYWPRLIVTDADQRDDSCPPDSNSNSGSAEDTSQSVQTRIAERLRFLYVGQRARAESVVQQRQPGLIEALVRQQIGSTLWQDDLGRMLFQLMVPHAFKDAARQLDRIVLVVDRYTANLPWELMLGDDPSRPDIERLPLALRTAVVRQLSSSSFRRQVRQGIARNALVIGNPSVQGFAKSFRGPANAELQDPPDLVGAQREADSVKRLLQAMGYHVEWVIGNEHRASDVMAALYRLPYRILHISAHGVFNLRHRDGLARSGVLLSDGLLVTAAEIEAMETVPELVFLNCCHLGKLDIGRDGNRLAASIARELIEIGVRCVIVAGWAVNDDNASLFGENFYEQLLLQRRTFGEAVFEARRKLWEHDRMDITWGAFQAYGDAGWRAEPPGEGSSGRSDKDLYASPDELLDDLAHMRAELSRKKDRQTERETQALKKSVGQKLEDRCPPGWLELPQIQSALGATWRDLGMFAEARTAFLKAVQAEDKAGHVPIRDIEQLANVEARLGEKSAQTKLEAKKEQRGRQPRVPTDADAKSIPESPEALIDLALQRLQQLDALVSAGTEGRPMSVPNAERSGIRGSALKRKASLYARRVLDEQPNASAVSRDAEKMSKALEDAAQAYASGEGTPGDGRFSPYLALNRLALTALTQWGSDAARTGAISLAAQCRQTATQNFARNAEFWDAAMQAEASLIGRLLDGRLSRADDDGRAVFDELVAEYDEALSFVPAKPSQIDSVVSQLELLSRFFDAASIAKRDPARRLVADRLLDLAQRIRPGYARRTDRPAGGKALRSRASKTPGAPPKRAATKTAVAKRLKSGTRARKKKS